MTPIDVTMLFISCLVTGLPAAGCAPVLAASTASVAGVQSAIAHPLHTGPALDVELTATSALVWDEDSGAILYEKNAFLPRPVASLSKLLSALVVRATLTPNAIIEIPPEVLQAQQQGVDVKLPVGEHATVSELLSAGLIASANDTFVTLAMAADGSEEKFAEHVNNYAQQHGFVNTRVHNATGLTGGEQYSTAYDLKEIFRTVLKDPILYTYLGNSRGVLHTQEGTALTYKTTNQLMDTYLPVLAGKTGYTNEALENLIILTRGEKGQRIGVVILGSTARFQDAKVLTEWIWRNYDWP
jgi:D-alanyl-D-alanine carboxypeptidase (penicillin-binding protein 5/6)